MAWKIARTSTPLRLGVEFRCSGRGKGVSSVTCGDRECRARPPCGVTTACPTRPPGRRAPLDARERQIPGLETRGESPREIPAHGVREDAVFLSDTASPSNAVPPSLLHNALGANDDACPKSRRRRSPPAKRGEGRPKGGRG